MSKKARTKRIQAAQAAAAAIADYNATLIQDEKARLLDAIASDAARGHSILDDGQEEISRFFFPETGTVRGGDKRCHGFFFEVLEVYGNNAELAAHGEEPAWKYLNDNSAYDAKYNDTFCQMKAWQKDGVLAFIKYAEKYPDSDGKVLYIVPKDIYEHYQLLSSLSPKEAGKLRKPEYTMYLKIKAYNEEHPEAVFKAGRNTYKEIQRDAVPATLEKEHDKVDEIQKTRSAQAREQCKPTLEDCLKAAGTGAVCEGAIGGIGSAISITHENRKNDESWDMEDTKTVVKETGKGAVKGAIRGAAVYEAAGRCASPLAGPAASAACSFVFEEAGDIYQYAKKEQSSRELSANTFLNAVDAVVTFGMTYLSKSIISSQIEKYTHSKLLGMAGGYIIGAGANMLIWQPARKALDKRLKEGSAPEPALILADC